MTRTKPAPTNDVRRMSADAARRVALAAQGFAAKRPTGKIDRRHLRKVMDTIGIIQIDSVNVLVRSQELPLFSRLGPYPRTLLADAVDDGELFETWAHVASILPSRDLSLVRWMMELRAAVAGGDAKRAAVRDNVLAQIGDRGPLAVGDLEGRVRNKGSWWDWDEMKVAVEHLFAVGTLGATRRRKDFARLYDLLDRILPADVIAAAPLSEAAGRKEMLRRAARHLGVATANDLADYYRINLAKSKPMLEELVADGALVPVAVEGWRAPAFLDPDAATPRTITGRAVLSPFDSLVWKRDRNERIFGFDYRIEIYTPAPKRIYGYYVLPFLLDGQLVGRVDLKADRQAGVLRVQGAFVEDDLDNPVDRAMVAEAMAAELADVARWLELPAVGIVDRGSLAGDLRRLGLEPLAANTSAPLR